MNNALSLSQLIAAPVAMRNLQYIESEETAELALAAFLIGFGVTLDSLMQGDNDEL
jgi:hypothetical protein